MQKLTLFENVFDLLDKGEVATIRKGILSIEMAKLLFESTELKRRAVVNVRKVYSCLLKDVLIEDMLNDGFKDHNHMTEQMTRFYSDITLDAEVTVVKFERLP